MLFNQNSNIALKLAAVKEKIEHTANNSKFKKVAGLILSILIFTVASASVLYYIFFASQGEFHSDCTDTIIWANASNESGHMFDTDFNYACFLPFGISLIMQPLVAVFGLSLTAHHLGMAAFFILLAVFMILLLREFKFSINRSLIGTSIFLAFTLSSKKMREIFWGHSIYYTLGILFVVIGCFILFKLFNTLDKLLNDPSAEKNTRIKFIVLSIIFFVFTMFTATDGISAMSIYCLPVIGAICMQHILDKRIRLFSKHTFIIFIMAALLLLSLLFGAKILAFWQGDMTAAYQDTYSRFTEMQNWMDNLHNVPLAWLRLFGVEAPTDKMLSDPEGITNMIRIFTAALTAVIPVIATCFYPKYKNDMTGKFIRIFIWIHWAVTALVLSGFVFGMLGSADWRLVPIIGTALILSIIFIAHTVCSHVTFGRFSALLIIPLFILSFINIKEVVKMPYDNYKSNIVFSIADVLESNDLTYGYASFWSANTVTLISGNKIKVRDVAIDNGSVNPGWLQTDNKWYKDQGPDQKEYFLLLSEDEMNMIYESGNTILNDSVRQLDPVINEKPYHIFIFDKNIF